MSRRVSGALRLAVVMVCGTLALAAGSRAGTAAVSSPFDDDVCVAPSEVIAALVIPTGFYAESPKCETLCKRARTDCIRYVKLASSCQRAAIGDDAIYAKQECEIEHEDDGVLKKECKTEIEHSVRDDRGHALDDRNGAVNACEDWGDTCEASCP